MGRKYNGPKIKNGYRLLRVGETLQKGDLVGFSGDPGAGWSKTAFTGNPYYAEDKETGLIYCRKIATPKAQKATAKPKDTKVSWTKKSQSIHPKATKADLAKLLQETVDQLNDIGAKWAKAQNTINTLKKKAGK